RQSLRAATAGVTGAHGAYDPLLQLGTDWERSTPPIASAFSGAPAGALAPTTTAATATVNVTQLLPTGGSVGVHGSAARQTSDDVYDLLSPSYATALGVELRQPLLRDRKVDPARVALLTAAADRAAAAAGLARATADTVADVERV